MKAIFIELSSFSARRSDYLTDDEFRMFQNVLMKSPKAGNVIAGTGGLRKIRIADPRRGKDEMEDLSKDEKKELKKLLEEALGNG